MPLLITGVVVALLGVILGAGMYLWQESAYEIGESEAQKTINMGAQPRGSENDEKVPKNQRQPQDSNALNQTVQGNANQISVTGPGQEQSEDAESSFEAAINQRNQKGMTDMMASTVNFVEEATECCGRIGKEAAAKNFLDYSEGTKLYNFAETQQIVKKMRVNLPQSFGPDKFTKIGVGSDKKVVAYRLNAQNKVDSLYIAISLDLFDLE